MPWWGNLIVTVACSYVLCAFGAACLGVPPWGWWTSPWFHLGIGVLGVLGIRWWNPMTTGMQRLGDVIATIMRYRGL